MRDTPSRTLRALKRLGRPAYCVLQAANELLGSHGRLAVVSTLYANYGAPILDSPPSRSMLLQSLQFGRCSSQQQKPIRFDTLSRYAFTGQGSLHELSFQACTTSWTRSSPRKIALSGVSSHVEGSSCSYT